MEAAGDIMSFLNTNLIKDGGGTKRYVYVWFKLFYVRIRNTLKCLANKSFRLNRIHFAPFITCGEWTLRSQVKLTILFYKTLKVN